MRLEKDVVYGQYKQCVLDAHLPQSNGFTTIVYFHGGGLVEGDKADKNNLELAEALVKEGYAFVSANYRMYIHDGKYPDFLVDAAQAVAFVKETMRTSWATAKCLSADNRQGRGFRLCFAWINNGLQAWVSMRKKLTVGFWTARK